MLLKPFTLLISTVVQLAATAPSPAKDWPFDVTELRAPDGSIAAKFVSVGATLTELLVNDRYGKPRDVILGYDDPTRLLTDPDHPVFNAIVGRYANRLNNGIFSIPITKNTVFPGPGVYKIPTNDHDGKVTLHGGIIGWDRRNWTVERKSGTSVTYKHIDVGHENFPGTVTVYATHTVSNGGVLKTVVRATASQQTPIMVTQHLYWNLDAFENGADTILDHHLQVNASKVIDVDGNAIPTGKFIDVENTPFDFRKEQTIGARWGNTINLCGQGCQGYDSAWIYDGDVSKKAGTSLWSDKSGIRVDISTNQPAVQLYSSYWMNTMRKAAHGGPQKKYGRWSAIAIEQEGYIAAVNTPEWGVDQIYSPDRAFEWSADYKFSTVP